MTVHHDDDYDEQGHPKEPMHKLHGKPPRTAYPGDVMRTTRGEGMVCSYVHQGTPESASVEVRYADGTYHSQPLNGNGRDSLLPYTWVSQPEQSPFPMKYVNREADLLFTWIGGRQITVRRGSTYSYHPDYEFVHTTVTGDDQITRIVVEPTYEAFKAACLAHIASLPGGRAQG